MQACVCKDIAKTEQKIQIGTEKRRFGKIITLVRGLSDDVDIKEVARSLKTGLACGGTVKNSVIELQGDHRKRVKPILIKLGFNENSIQD